MGAAQPLVPVRNSVAVVVDAVEGDMHMRMLLVEMSGNEELRVPNAHSFHIFKCDTSHYTVGQSWLVLFGEADGDMSDWLRNLAVYLRLDVETHGDGFLVFHEQAVVCHHLRPLAFVKDVIHHTLEVASLYDFRHHIPILFRSS